MIEHALADATFPNEAGQVVYGICHSPPSTVRNDGRRNGTADAYSLSGRSGPSRCSSYLDIRDQHTRNVAR